MDSVFLGFFYKRFMFSLVIIAVALPIHYTESKAPVSHIVEHEPSSLRDEVIAISELITAQRKRLDRQIELKNQMLQFRMQKEEFLKGSVGQKHALNMVINAKEILMGINQQHLAYLFSPEYIEELQFFSSVIEKNRPMRP
ncbi:MAG: hypothetical protein NT065_01855 [Chlamydiae bacterium]|nr:hypothetical protein [Chlamydiota bacterium]